MNVEKQTIRINFCGCNNEFKEKSNLILNILKKHYNIEISENPDYVFCGIGGNHFEYMKYDCVRIMVMTENFSPDFSIFDYYIGFDFIDFGDRYFRLPYSLYNQDGKPWLPELVSEEQARRYLNEKKYFCNFIYRHESSHGIREKVFDAVNSYKTITSAGNFRNNMFDATQNFSNNGGKLLIETNEKLKYLTESKFTIAVESVIYPGFETEKIVHAFQTHSIPIYYGAETITNTYNENAFIHVNPSNMQETVEKIQYIDNHDEKYIEMLTECPLKDRMAVVDLYNKLEEFLLNVFSVEPKYARRRPKEYYVASVEDSLKQLYASKMKRNTGLRKKARAFKRKIKKLI